MTTISAHRILAELKIIADRINTASREQFISYTVGDDGVPSGYKTLTEFEERAKSKYESAIGLIKRRNALKSALVASNAVTTVTINGVTMTVAEAIDRKDAIMFEKQLLSNLRGQYANVVNRIEGERRILDNQITKRIEDAGGKERKVTATEEQEITAMSKKRFEPHFADPINAVEKIDALTKEIQDFELEVDTALSESNARTMIEVAE